jgi:hypothetical protein
MIWIAVTEEGNASMSAYGSLYLKISVLFIFLKELERLGYSIDFKLW